MNKLGKYEIIKLIGQGAYAEVYQAVDTVLQRTVALKLLKSSLTSDEEAVARFLQEAQTAATLIHPNIAWVWDLGQLDGRFYLAMRYIEGQSLDQFIKIHGALAWDAALKTISQVGNALTFAHGHNLVHRDVKPQNIMVSPTEGVVLTDFGLVRAMEASSIGTRTGALMGTPAYIAPEIWQGDPVGPAADQYSLGCVLVELLTGKPLFAGATPPVVMRQHLLVGPVLPEVWPASCPAGLTAVIQQALAQSPNERYQDISAFITALVELTGQAARASAINQQSNAPAPASNAVSNQPPPAAGTPVQPSPAPLQDPWPAPVEPVTMPKAQPMELRSLGSTRPANRIQPESGSLPSPTTANRSKLSTWAIAAAIMGIMAILTVIGLITAGGVIMWQNRMAGTALDEPAASVETVASMPTATAVSMPTATTVIIPPTNILFEDDFSKTSSGWDRFDKDGLVTDYANGGYRILVGNTNWYNWANPYKSFTDVRVEVDVTKQASPEGDAGIICRYVDTSNFYFLRITTDGYYAISKLVDGTETTLGAGEYTETSAVKTGTGVVNHVRGDCVGSTLTLYVNGTLLEQVVDSDLTSGDVGLLGGSFDEGGVDLLFDNFVVYKP